MHLVGRHLQLVPGAVFPRKIKRPGHKTDHLPQTSVEDMNKWSYDPLPYIKNSLTKERRSLIFIGETSYLKLFEFSKRSREVNGLWASNVNYESSLLLCDTLLNSTVLKERSELQRSFISPAWN